MQSAAGYLGDDAVYLIDKAVEPDAQFDNFVIAANRQAFGQITLALSDVLDAVHHFLDRPGYGPRNKQSQQYAENQEAQETDSGGNLHRPHVVIHFVDVDAGADHPTPRL